MTRVHVHDHIHVHVHVSMSPCVCLISMSVLFNLYDLTGTGKIGKKEFRKMTIAMMETGERTQQHVIPRSNALQAQVATSAASEGPGERTREEQDASHVLEHCARQCW